MILFFCAAYLMTGCTKWKEGTKTAGDLVASGEGYLGKGKLNDAIKEFKKALVMEPDNFDASYGLGAAYYKKKDFQNAEEMIRKAIDADPREPEAHNMLGLIFEKEGLFENAKKAFQQALQLNKNFAEAQNNLLNIDAAKTEYNFYRLAIDFIYLLSKEYSNGNNAFLNGASATGAVKNEGGATIRYDVNYEIYLAKEYFDKCSKLLEELDDRTAIKPPLEMIDIFSTAIQQRQEAIDLQVQGYSMSGSYAGEFERAQAKIRIADTYYVDAMKKLEERMRGNAALFSDKDFSAVQYLIGYYSSPDKTEKVKVVE
ncbi:MAG: tetratricopeptide repeat protein [Candidatus Omnitrophota bacterium]